MNVPALAVDREVLVRARPATVFRFFTDPTRFSAWFGSGSTIDARPGGEVVVRFPGGAEARGEVLDVVPDVRVVFTWGYPGADSPLPVGGSTVRIELDPHDEGTLVRLTHTVPSEEMRLAHVAGWRHHLSHLATLALRDHRPDGGGVVDRWFAVWAEDDETARHTMLEELCDRHVEVVDDLVTVVGIDELAGHITNARRHMPDVTTERSSPVLSVADQVTCDWHLRHPSLGVVGDGRTVVTVDLDGRVRRVVGFWATPPDEVSRRLFGEGS